MTVTRAAKLPWVIVAFVAPVLSCSLIVQFHDQDAGEDGGPRSDDAAMDVTVEGQAEAESDAGLETTAEAAAVDNLNPCYNTTNGWRCGDNGLADLLPSNDLVHCYEGGVDILTLCDAGCLHVVDPFPDSCNPCNGQMNGDYCGKQLAGFNPDNGDILIGCTGGQVSLQDACAHGCGPNGVMSACY